MVRNISYGLWLLHTTETDVSRNSDIWPSVLKNLCISSTLEADPSSPVLLLCVFAFPSACRQTVRTQTKMSSRPSAPKVCLLHNKGFAKASSHARSHFHRVALSWAKRNLLRRSCLTYAGAWSVDIFTTKYRVVVIHTMREIKKG